MKVKQCYQYSNCNSTCRSSFWVSINVSRSKTCSNLKKRLVRHKENTNDNLTIFYSDFRLPPVFSSLLKAAGISSSACLQINTLVKVWLLPPPVVNHWKNPFLQSNESQCRFKMQAVWQQAIFSFRRRRKQKNLCYVSLNVGKYIYDKIIWHNCLK